MSFVTTAANIANVTTVYLEDAYGVAHPVQGMVNYGPVKLDSAHNCNGFIFGTEIDKMFREAGWTLVGKNGASGEISWVLLRPPDAHSETDPRTGLKTYPDDAPIFEQIWLTDDGGDAVRTYNPDLFDPPGSFPFEKGGPPWIPEGMSAYGTLHNVAEAMGGRPFAPGEWSGIDIYWLLFPVDDWGSLANERSFGQNGFFALCGNHQGAGKIFESPTLGDSTNQMKLRVTFSMVGGSAGNNVQIQMCALMNNGDGTFNKIGSTYTNIMMTQPDYIFMIDPHSFYMFSLQGNYHADLYQNSNVFCTMLNTTPAFPQHSALPQIPQTAIFGRQLGGLLGMGGVGTDLGMFQNPCVWDYGTTQIPGSTNPGDEAGVSFQFIRNGPGPLYNNDYSDIIDAARVLVSTDTSGPGGLAQGPMQWLGNLWNGLTIQRDLGQRAQAWVPDTPDAGEETLPKSYYTILHQNGGEEAFIFDGTAGSVMIAGADYSYLRQFEREPDPLTGESPVAVFVDGESNLFTPLQALSGARVDFKVTGGRPVRFDPGDPSRYLPPKFTITIGGYPGDGSWKAVQDADNHAHIESDSPGSVGSWRMSIHARDTFGNQATLLYNLVVGPVSVLRWSVDRLPSGTAGTPYFIQGGDTSATFTFVGGILPPGLFFDADDGTISGIPGSGGLYEFQIGIDVAGTSVTRDFILQIN